MLKRNWPIWLVALLGVVIRDPADALHHWLWAEDGSIFLAQAHAGPWSILWPYHGYLHLYPRLAALLALAVPLPLVPHFFALAWLLALLAAVTVMADCARAAGAGRVAVPLFIALVALQPGSVELLFCLTNAQWWLGAALLLYVCMPREQATGRWAMAAVLLAALSGPFALLALPALGLRAWWWKDWRAQSGLYGAVLAAAALQSLFLVGSPRDVGIGFGAADMNTADWAWAAWQGAGFGGTAAALLFWPVLLAGLALRQDRQQPAAAQGRRQQALVLLTIVVTLAAAAIAARHNARALSPFGVLGRYFFIPYTLAFFLVVVWFRGAALAAVVASLFAVCLADLRHPQQDEPRENLQWPAYTRLARQQPGVMIPVNPLYGHVQGWHVLGEQLVQPEPAPLLDIDANALRADHAVFARSHDGSLAVQAATGSPGVIVDIGNRCAGDTYLGLAVAVTREHAGYAALYWSADGVFSERERLRGFYPAGPVTMWFAFARSPGEHVLRVDPYGNDSGNSRLYSVRLSCLGW